MITRQKHGKTEERTDEERFRYLVGESQLQKGTSTARYGYDLCY